MLKKFHRVKKEKWLKLVPLSKNSSENKHLIKQCYSSDMNNFGHGAKYYG